MKRLFQLSLALTLSGGSGLCLAAEAAATASSPSVEVHADSGVSAGVVPWANLAIKNSDGDYWYTGVRSTASLGVWVPVRSKTFAIGLRADFEGQYLENNAAGAAKEAITTTAIPISLALWIPFIPNLSTQIGGGPAGATLRRYGDQTLNQTYSQGIALKAGWGLTPPPGKNGVVFRHDISQLNLSGGKEKQNPNARLADLTMREVGFSLGYLFGF